jgi:hypothetical protein
MPAQSTDLNGRTLAALHVVCERKLDMTVLDMREDSRDDVLV